MAKAIGRAFKVSKKDVSGYGYASPKTRGKSLKPNPGVTAIAAINGRGAYRGRKQSARQAMAGLSREERIGRARQVTNGPNPARGENMATQRQIAAARRNIRKAIAAKRSGGARSLRRNSWPNDHDGHVAAGNLGVKRRKARARKAAKAVKGSKPAARRTTAKRKMRSNATPRQRAAARRNIKKAQAALRRNRTTKRTRTSARKRTLRRNTTSLKSYAASRGRTSPARSKRSSAKRRTLRSNVSRKRSLAAKKGWRMRRNKATKSRATKRRGLRRNTTAKQRAAARRNIRKAQAARRRMSPNRRRKGMKRNAAKRRSTKRRSMRRNATARRYGAKAFRRNQAMATIMGAMKAGVTITAGFAAQKALSAVVCKMVCDKLFGAPAAPAAAPEPAAIDGLESLQPYSKVIASGVAAVAGIVGANMLLKDVETKKLVTGGMATAFLHQVLVTVLEGVSPEAATALSGVGSDAEAARLSAMYGFGATSIQPRFAPIGMGAGEQNPWTAAAGMGGGMGEYFAEAMNGLGAYENNPDLYQAAAGFGALNNANTNHVDPSSNLDRELSIAEAAAGVGEYFESGVSGVGEYFESGVSGLGSPYQAAAGMGNIERLPTANTWVPGMADPQIWAGVRAISQGQPAHATTRAGILTSGGSQGVFG